MTLRHRRSPVKSVVAALSIACFLAFAQGAVTRAVAADTWETWPPKKPAAGVEAPAPEAGAAKAGEAAGTKTYAGLSAGTWGWIALGTAAVVGLAFALGGGGGDGTTAAPTHP